MNQLNKFIKEFFLKRFIDEAVIYEKDGRYYSNCAQHEEITFELKEIFEDD